MRIASLSRGAAAIAAVLGTLTFPGPARANGRYPAAGQIAIHPSNASTLLVRATYGILLSWDAGKTWSWLCEPAVGYNGVEDPMMGFAADGTILAGIFEGLAVGSSDACQWSFVPGQLLNQYVVDLAVDKHDPTKAVLVISNSAGQDDAGAPTFLTQLWQSSDSGKTWAQAGTTLPPAFLGLTVDTAPSSPDRVYVSGRLGPPGYPGVIERSDDRGATWQQISIPGADSTHLPYIGAIDPQNPDVVYVRLDADPSDTLLVTKDGGMTWSTAYTAAGKLYGFALSPDGSTVAIGGDTDGVLTAPSSTLAFTKASGVGALCLTWGQAGLYACANEFKDGFTAGMSTDQGKTFTPLMHLSGICPLTCSEPDSGVTALCPSTWAMTASSINATCGVDGGAGTGGGSAGSSSGGGGAPGAGSSHGCSSSLGGGGAGGAAVLSLAGLLAAWLDRRRSRRA